MEAIVSLLDHEHSQAIEEIWTELENHFGLSGILSAPFPHFSYQVAAGFSVGRMPLLLEAIAAETAPFVVRTAGIGIFPGKDPVIHVPIVRTRELSELHARIWCAGMEIGSGIRAHYHPDHWAPHITVAQHDISSEHLGAVAEFLNAKSLHWEIRIAGLTHIAEVDEQNVMGASVAFSGER